MSKREYAAGYYNALRRPMLLICVLVLALVIGLAMRGSGPIHSWGRLGAKKAVQAQDTGASSPAARQTSPPSGTTYTEDGASAARDARNASRQGDSMELLNHVREFYADNITKFPTAYQDGKLTAPDTRSETTPLSFYKTVTFGNGVQPPASTDSISVVTGAVCAPDGSTAASSVPDDFAIQHATEQADGSFRSICAAY
jgi:hypothetical protein